MFNLKDNKYWYSYTHEFSSLEYLLLLRATFIRKKPAPRFTTFLFKYGFSLTETNKNFEPIDGTKRNDYIEVLVECGSQAKYCATQQLYLSTSMRSGTYLINLTPLNLEEVRQEFQDISLDLVEMNPDANIFLTFIKSVLFFMSIAVLFLYLRSRKQLNKRSKTESTILVLAAAVVALDFPTILLSLLINFFVANLVFVVFVVTTLCTSMHLWLHLLQTALQDGLGSSPSGSLARSKKSWLWVGLITCIWLDLFSGACFFIYEYQRNPAFHLEER